MEGRVLRSTHDEIGERMSHIFVETICSCCGAYISVKLNTFERVKVGGVFADGTGQCRRCKETVSVQLVYQATIINKGNTCD